MYIESAISYQLNKHPALKKMVKRVYQRGMCAISHKMSSDGDIIQVSPDDNAEYFFGYYDKSPWDRTDRYMICMRAKNTWSDTAPPEPAEIILIDTMENNDVRVLAATRAWNVQQGCMAQWLGPDFDRSIIYNDYRNGQYCSIILDIIDMTERVLPMPVYTVSIDGNTALSLDFSRLHRLRPGYGYANIPDQTAEEKLPDSTCVWRLDLKRAVAEPMLKYTDLARFEPRPEMEMAVHKVNHLMLSPDGQRFMLLHRWFSGHRKYTRLVTCNIDSTEMFNLSDDDMVSHCFWKNDYEILAFENKKEGGTGYYLMRDRTCEYSRMWPELGGDGHPSYSPDGSLVVTDTYPNRKRIAEVRIMQGDVIFPVARVFAPFKYDNDTRCDLHPRWSRGGQKICFDSVFEGRRGLYIVNVPTQAFVDAPSIQISPECIENKKCLAIYYCDLVEEYGNLFYCKSGLGLFLDEISTRYDYVYFCAPVKKILKSSDLYPIHAKNIIFQKLPPFVGFIGAIKKMRSVKREIKKYSSYWNDAIYMRWPTPFVDYAYSMVAKKKLPVAIHIVGDVKEIVKSTDKYQGVKKLAAIAYASVQEHQVKQLIKKGVPTLVNGSGIRHLYEKQENKNIKEIRSATISAKDYDDDFVQTERADNLLYVGTLKNEKGLDYLIGALPSLIRQGISVNLTIVGDGPMRESLELMCKDLGVDKFVTFTGYIAFGPMLKSIYRSNSIFVLPSISEGTPRVLIEAMANKLAVVATNVGGVPYTVTDQVNGLLVNSQDSDSIANAILKLIEDKDLYAGLIEEGYRFAKENTIEHFVDEICSSLAQEGSN